MVGNSTKNSQKKSSKKSAALTALKKGNTTTRTIANRSYEQMQIRSRDYFTPEGGVEAPILNQLTLSAVPAPTSFEPPHPSLPDNNRMPVEMMTRPVEELRSNADCIYPNIPSNLELACMPSASRPALASKTPNLTNAITPKVTEKSDALPKTSSLKRTHSESNRKFPTLETPRKSNLKTSAVSAILTHD